MDVSSRALPWSMCTCAEFLPVSSPNLPVPLLSHLRTRADTSGRSPYPPARLVAMKRGGAVKGAASTGLTVNVTSADALLGTFTLLVELAGAPEPWTLTKRYSDFHFFHDKLPEAVRRMMGTDFPGGQAPGAASDELRSALGQWMAEVRVVVSWGVRVGGGSVCVCAVSLRRGMRRRAPAGWRERSRGGVLVDRSARRLRARAIPLARHLPIIAAKRNSTARRGGVRSRARHVRARHVRAQHTVPFDLPHTRPSRPHRPNVAGAAGCGGGCSLASSRRVAAAAAATSSSRCR